MGMYHKLDNTPRDKGTCCVSRAEASVMSQEAAVLNTAETPLIHYALDFELHFSLHLPKHVFFSIAKSFMTPTFHYVIHIGWYLQCETRGRVACCYHVVGSVSLKSKPH